MSYPAPDLSGIARLATVGLATIVIGIPAAIALIVAAVWCLNHVSFH